MTSSRFVKDHPSVSLNRYRTSTAGTLLLAMICLSIVWGFDPDKLIVLHWISGVLVVVAAALLFPDVGTGPRLQVGVLLITGVALLIYAWMHGVEVSAADAVSRNTGLMSMILAVGFLKVVVVRDDEAIAELPKGRRAYLNTLVGVGVFGSFINISAPLVICDRLALQSPTDFFTARSITRVFSACAAWSPYFAGAAVVLTYVKGVSLVQIMVTGFPFLLVALLVVYWLSVSFHREKVEQFFGYPISPSSLWIPALLSALVILTWQSLPNVSILVVIALSSLILTAGTLVVRHNLKVSISKLAGYVKNGLPRTATEVQLFLAAGVLAAGLTSMVDAGLITFSLSTFDVGTACVLLAVMVVIAALGIHPVIQISGLTPLVMTANPDPDLLAVTYLFAWSLGTCASPLSGTHLIFQGRYGIPAWRGALQNWGYVVVMYGVAVVLLYVHSMLS